MAIICHCEVVKERTIVKAVCRGARTLAEVQEECGVAMQCGSCAPSVLELIARHQPGAVTAGSSSMSGVLA